ncbi:hypothetical protein NESM_000590500 [Novymonas esmeraldas]|uniref:Uncharacterized protein n=1 Tax=Novymonas esmeraldas TaxID=1808958 RepID=A0AAW0EQN4_9TRYP
MSKAQVTERIQRWRELKEKMTEKTNQVEARSKAVHELECRRVKEVQEWELDKEERKGPLSAAAAEVASSTSNIERIEHETQELRRKVEERCRRTREHTEVIQKRKKAVSVLSKEVRGKDDSAQERLAEYTRTRQEVRRQLQAAMKKHEVAALQDQAAYEDKMRQHKSRSAEILATIEAEAKSHALEQAMNEWNEKSNARKHVQDEVAAAEEGKDVWAELLQEAHAIRIQDNLKTLAELRAMVSI